LNNLVKKIAREKEREGGWRKKEGKKERELLYYTTDDIQSALRHNGEDIQLLTYVVVEMFGAFDGLLVKDVDEAVEDLEVKGRR